MPDPFIVCCEYQVSGIWLEMSFFRASKARLCKRKQNKKPVLGSRVRVCIFISPRASWPHRYKVPPALCFTLGPLAQQVERANPGVNITTHPVPGNSRVHPSLTRAGSQFDMYLIAGRGFAFSLPTQLEVFSCTRKLLQFNYLTSFS